MGVLLFDEGESAGRTNRVIQDSSLSSKASVSGGDVETLAFGSMQLRRPCRPFSREAGPACANHMRLLRGGRL